MRNDIAMQPSAATFAAILACAAVLAFAIAASVVAHGAMVPLAAL